MFMGELRRRAVLLKVAAVLCKAAPWLPEEESGLEEEDLREPSLSLSLVGEATSLSRVDISDVLLRRSTPPLVLDDKFSTCLCDVLGDAI
jgi:hypothetical protein